MLVFRPMNTRMHANFILPFLFGTTWTYIIFQGSLGRALFSLFAGLKEARFASLPLLTLSYSALLSLTFSLLLLLLNSLRFFFFPLRTYMGDRVFRSHIPDYTYRWICVYVYISICFGIWRFERLT